jgi:hypothetical protein
MNKYTSTLLKTETEEEAMEFTHRPNMESGLSDAWQSLQAEITDSGSKNTRPVLDTQWMDARRRKVRSGM